MLQVLTAQKLWRPTRPPEVPYVQTPGLDNVYWLAIMAQLAAQE